MAFTCPRCGRASQDPEDARQGYCGACHDWTAAAEGPARPYQCESCGHRAEVPPGRAGRVWCPCGPARAVAPAPRAVIDAAAPYVHAADAEALARGLWQYTGRTEEDMALRCIRARYGRVLAEDGLVTGSQRISGTDSGDCTATEPGDGDTPWTDPMEWSPGDAELLNSLCDSYHSVLSSQRG